MDAKDRLAMLAKGGRSVDAAARAYADRGDHVKGATPGDEAHPQADELDATVEAMFLMAAVDGAVAGVEVAQLAATMQAMLDTRERREPIDLDATLVDLSRRLERDGWSARLDEVAHRLRTEDARAFAFRLAAAVAFVDDHVAHAEAAAIDALAAALGLSSDVSQQILNDVRDSLFG
jgi:tellurite resistance protein